MFKRSDHLQVRGCVVREQKVHYIAIKAFLWDAVRFNLDSILKFNAGFFIGVSAKRSKGSWVFKILERIYLTDVQMTSVIKLGSITL